MNKKDKNKADKTQSINEAIANIRKKKNGQYQNLAFCSVVNFKKTHLSDKKLMKLFENLRLRFTLTTQCNLWCFFCSNEGSSYESKRVKYEVSIDEVIKLSEMFIANTKLKGIDFSGGEPTNHSDFLTGKHKLLNWTKKFPKMRFSIQTNGINLTPGLVDELNVSFSRIGISIHSFDFEKWNSITNVNSIFSLGSQKIKFKRLMNNLAALSQKNIGHKVFLKSVIMRGVNDAVPDILNFLDKCNQYKFHPKFLEFEPQYPDQKKYITGRIEFMEKLKKIGCKLKYDSKYDDPDMYIPAVTFDYKDAPTGLHGIFRCGTLSACKACYRHLCMFVKPKESGSGLCLKPCSIMDTQIDISRALKNNNFRQIMELFRLSREYLMLTPGLGAESWRGK